MPETVRTFTPPPVNVAAGDAGAGRLPRRRRFASQRRHRSGRSHRGGRGPADRGALAGRHREGQGDDPEQADPLPGELARALRSLGRTAHLRGRGRDDRDAQLNQPVLRAGLGGAADPQSGSAGQVEKAATFETFTDKHVAHRRQAHGRGARTSPATATTTRSRWSTCRPRRSWSRWTPMRRPRRTRRPPAAPNPFAVNLLRQHRAAEARRGRIAPLHGRVGTLAELRKVVGREATGLDARGRLTANCRGRPGPCAGPRPACWSSDRPAR